RYCKEVRGFQVYDPQKVRRPKIPKHEVEYLTKEEVQRFIRRTSQSTEPILRTLGLAPQGEGAGLERKFDIVATVDLRLDLQHLLIERAHRLKMRGHNRDECELHETFPFSERWRTHAWMDVRSFPWMAPAHTIFIQHELCHRAETVYQ